MGIKRSCVLWMTWTFYYLLTPILIKLKVFNVLQSNITHDIICSLYTGFLSVARLILYTIHTSDSQRMKSCLVVTGIFANLNSYMDNDSVKSEFYLMTYLQPD